jgi:hypothetical protein
MKTKDTFLIEFNDGDVKLLGAEVMKSRREAGIKKRQGEIRPEYSIGELKRFAQMAIDERIEFCKKKKDEPLDKCVCESIGRYIKLFTDSPMKGDKHLTKLRLDAIQKLFDEMKREGKIKCPDKDEKNGNQPKRSV